MTDLAISSIRSGIPESQESSRVTIGDICVESPRICQLAEMLSLCTFPESESEPEISGDIIGIYLSCVGAPPRAMTMERIISPTMTHTLILESQNSNSPKILIPK